MRASGDPRWQRLAEHPVGGADAALLHSRVARAQAWTDDDAHAAVEEYRRFAFLACQGREVTPSKAVDAVWHEHLMFTRDYWDVFCPVVLGMPLHHTPGGEGEDAHFHAQYERTLAAYESWFGPPPAKWWPQRGARLPVAAEGRAEGGRFGARNAGAIALAMVPAVAWAATRPANPLDWNGQDFLVLFLGLMALVAVATPILRATLRSRQGEVRDVGGALSTLETAYLAGGVPRAIDAGVAELHHRGVLRWDRAARRFERNGARGRLDAPSEALASVFAGNAVNTAASRAVAALAPVRDGLQRRGLFATPEAARRMNRLCALPATALLVFGLAKIAIGVQREKPVTLLAILCAVTAIYALVQAFRAPRPTRAGERALARKQAERRAQRNAFDDIGLAVALGGTSLLAGTALAGYHEQRTPSSSSSDSSGSSGSDSSSSDSGGSSCGSSCGGCGGGGGD